MGTRIEWADLGHTEPSLYAPGEANDDHGNTNELPALFAGEGVVIEGTPRDWLAFAVKIADEARAWIADEEGEDAPASIGDLIEALRATLDANVLEVRESGKPIRPPVEDAARALVDALDPQAVSA